MDAMANPNATMSAMSPLAPMMFLMMMPAMQRNSSAVPNASQNLSENLRLANRTINMFPPGINRPQMNGLFPWSVWFWGFHIRPRPQFGLPPPPLIQPPQQPFPGTFPFAGVQQMPPMMPPQQMQPVNPIFPFNPAIFPPMIPPMPIPGPATETPPAPTEQPNPSEPETQQPQTPEPSSPQMQSTTQPSRFLFPNCGLNIRELMSKTNGRNQLRIVGGRDTPIDLIPWQVSLQRPRNYEMRHYCGGAVIHPQFILTAAHCLDWCMSQTGMLSPSIKSMRIVAGTDTPRMLNYIPGGYGGHGYNPSAPAYRGPERQVAQAFIFPGYVKSKSNNDIALLRLDRPLPLFPFAKINTICLPSPEEPVAGPVATTSGWGQTVEKGKQSFYLKSVNVSVVPDSHCLEAYGSKSYNPKQMLCAGDEGKDSCQGDSGGPLFQKDPSIARMVQFGITSFGYGCARKGYPGIYTKVSSYSAWAQGIIQGSADMMG